MLASPFVGVSNDGARRRSAAPRRGGRSSPGSRRACPRGSSERDARLLQAFRQRYDRLAALAGTVGLERLCEQIVVEHDYDLAVLAQWDGRRRYANLRKLARLARSYEELRGPDVEGFVRFVLEQDAAGVQELEAVAEEEGAGAVRLLTIHAAKGLEFKVVVVADAGRERPPTSGEEIICLPDGRFGFKVVDPLTGQRHGARSSYDEVREAEEAAEEAERLRLYYVAMTRAIDRLIVAGSVDGEHGATRRRRSAGCSTGSSSSELEDGEVVRGEARLRVRVDRYAARGRSRSRRRPAGDVAAVAVRGRRRRRGRRGSRRSGRSSRSPRRRSSRCAASPTARSRSSSAAPTASTPSASSACGRSTSSGRIPGQTGMAGTEIGDAVHRLLERVDLAVAGAAVARRGRCPGTRPRPREELGADRRPRRGLLRLAARRAARGARRRRARSGRSRSSTTACSSTASSTCSTSTAAGRSSSTTSRTSSASSTRPRSFEAEYRLQRLVYAIACFRAGADEVEVVYQFLERPDDVVDAIFRRDELPALEAELSEAIARIQAGEFPPRPSEFACAGCPALDVVCAGPALLG